MNTNHKYLSESLVSLVNTGDAFLEKSVKVRKREDINECLLSMMGFHFFIKIVKFSYIHIKIL